MSHSLDLSPFRWVNADAGTVSSGMRWPRTVQAKHQLVRPEEKFCGLTSMTHGILPTMRRSVPLQGYRRRLGFVSDAVGERADDAR